MATVEECREALEKFGAELAGADESVRAKSMLDRTVSCRLSDLDVTFHGRLRQGALEAITTDPAPPAKIRLTLTSDDLLALVAGDLPFASAWARGRVRVEASFADVLRLRSLL